MSDVDFAALFAAEKGHLRTSFEDGLIPDGEMVLAWERVPQNHSKEAADWYRTNRKTLTNPLVNNIARTGVYRLQTIEEEIDPRRDAESLRTLVATYAKGFDEILVWAQGRIVGGTDWESAGQNDRFLSVEFPNQNKDDLPAILASVRGATYTDPSIGGSDAFTGDWLVLAADVRMVEDGSSTLTLHIGRPEFQLRSFRDFGLPSHNSVTYRWNVPKKDAQAFITGAQGEGVTVTASYSGTSDINGTVDLVISDNDVTPVSLTTTDVGTSCDIKTTTQYLWGQTKAQINTLVTDQYTDQTEGQTQAVRVSFSADSGKYSFVGTTVVSSKHPVTEAWKIENLAIDRDTDETTWFRWNVKQSEIETWLTDNDFYDNEVEGVQRSLRITRNPDCTYDFVAVKTTKLEPEATLTFTVGTRYDTDQEQTYFWTQTREDVDNIKDNYRRAEDDAAFLNDGVTRSVRVSRRSDLYYDVIVFIATRDQNEFTEPILMDTSKNVIQSDQYYWTIDRVRLKELVAAFKTEGPTNTPEGAEEDEQNTVSRSTRIVRNDDGSFNLVTSKVEHAKVDQVADHETAHEKDTTTYTWNLDKVGLDAVLAELDDKKLEVGSRAVSVSKTDDDVYSVTVRLNRQKGQEDEVSWTIGDEEGQLGIVNKIHFYFGLFFKEDSENQLEGDDEQPITVESVITGVEADTSNTEYSVSLGRNGDGTFDMVVRSTLDNGAAILDAEIGNEARKTTYSYKWAETATDAKLFVETLLDNTDHVGKSASIRRNRDGTFDVSLIKQEEKDFPLAGQVVQKGSNFTRTNTYQWGSDTSTLPAIGEHVVGTTKTLQLSRDSNGNIDWVEQTTDVSEFISSSYIHSKEVFPDGTTARIRTAQLFEGNETIPALDASSGGRVEVNYDPATGTYSGRIVTTSFEQGGFNGANVTLQVVVRMNTTNSAGAPYFYDRTDQHDVLLTTSLTSAINHASGGDHTSFYRGVTSGFGSGYEAHKVSLGAMPGAGNWIAINVPA